MGGPRDSSLTRVQPAFEQLGRIVGPWVSDFCKLGSRALSVAPNEVGWSGVLTRSPQFEHKALAPLDYLEYLVTHSWDPVLIAQERVENDRPEIRRMRDALFGRDAHVTDEALARLHEPDGRRSKKGSWQVLEGTTKVDCALFAENVTVFVEGKRTEPHLTDATQWHRQRNQVVRNLDCLRVEPHRADQWFVLLVVEEGTSAHSEALAFDDDLAGFQASVPHLDTEEVEGLRNHYLGFTTWQAIQSRFGLEPYPDVVEGVSRRSRKCPECGASGIPIAYGLPPYFPLGMAAERGLIALGGCVVTNDQPTWQCPSCGNSWDGPNPTAAIRKAIKIIGSEPI